MYCKIVMGKLKIQAEICGSAPKHAVHYKTKNQIKKNILKEEFIKSTTDLYPAIIATDHKNWMKDAYKSTFT